MNNRLSLYERSKDFLWTDEYISRNMLEAHLNPEIDAASRNRNTVLRTVDWIVSVLPKKGSLLDLGCGPGLYAQEFAEKGFIVTGLDISKRSIEYAGKSAQDKNLSINYVCADYINNKIEGKFDAAVCIYCDFGALIPSEQKAFLENVRGALKDEGVLILDVFGYGLSSTKKEFRSWEYNDSPGFLCNTNHFIMSEVVYFEQEKVWGSRNIVSTENSIKEYTTWDTMYSKDSITELLNHNCFTVQEINTSLVSSNSFTSDDVLFVKAVKKC